MSRPNIYGGLIDAIFNRVRLRNNTVTLAGALTLTAKSAPLQFLDPGGSTRIITLPAEADSDGLAFIIVNTAGAAEDLTVNDDAAATVGTVAGSVTASAEESGLFFCDGTTWRCMVATQT